MKKLFLDDVRQPKELGWDVVRTYDAFVKYLDDNGCPDVVSFDHDLAFEHYPFADPQPTEHIRYDHYKEKTGYDCAKWLIDWCRENKRFPRLCVVHSYNPAGAMNIFRELSAAGIDAVIEPY